MMGATLLRIFMQPLPGEREVTEHIMEEEDTGLGMHSRKTLRRITLKDPTMN